MVKKTKKVDKNVKPKPQPEQKRGVEIYVRANGTLAGIFVDGADPKEDNLTKVDKTPSNGSDVWDFDKEEWVSVEPVEEGN